MPILPVIQMPKEPGDNDIAVVEILQEASVLPLSKGIYPQYREPSFFEDNFVSTWSQNDFARIKRMSTHSRELWQLVHAQISAMEGHFEPGECRHGIICDLRDRQAGVRHLGRGLEVTFDQADSARLAMPRSWQYELGMLASIKSNTSITLVLDALQDKYGIMAVDNFLDAFYLREQEKSWQREVWGGDLPIDNWEERLLAIKRRVKPHGYEAFALPQKTFMSLHNAYATANSIKTTLEQGGHHVTFLKDEASQVIIDRQAKLISATGKAFRIMQDTPYDKHMQNMTKAVRTVSKVASFFGRPGLEKMLDIYGDFKYIGPVFQFQNYNVNWLPPHAEIEYLDDGNIRIAIPERWILRYSARQFFAARDFNQYQYLVAEGVQGINHGYSGRDIIKQFKAWDQAYGLSILNASYDGASCKLDSLPQHIDAFVAELKRFCPDIESPDAKKQLLENKMLHFWWD